jgi:DNA-binding protein
MMKTKLEEILAGDLMYKLEIMVRFNRETMAMVYVADLYKYMSGENELVMRARGASIEIAVMNLNNLVTTELETVGHLKY